MVLKPVVNNGILYFFPYQLVDMVAYLIIYMVLYIPGGCLGFLASTVVVDASEISKMHKKTGQCSW